LNATTPGLCYNPAMFSALTTAAQPAPISAGLLTVVVSTLVLVVSVRIAP
jgi:hypothetical protein